MKITNNTLSGKFNYESTLSGKIEIKIDSTFSKIKEIKIYILNNIFLPAIQKKWDQLKENLLCVDHIQQKLNYYSEKYPLGELDYYKNLIQLIELLMIKENELNSIEKNNHNYSDDITTIFYKTCYVKLKPEYEIYNLILGKPNKNEKYDLIQIQKIGSLLKKDNISFQQIKKIIENKTQYSII
jgi:hypothetical protein